MPLEKSQERPSLSENTERLSRPGLRLTDELELRFLENLREHGRTKGTISTYRRNLSKLRKYLPEDSNLDPAFLSSWQSELLEQGYSPGTVNSCTATVNETPEETPDLSAGAAVWHNGPAASLPVPCDCGGRTGRMGVCSTAVACPALPARGAAGLCRGAGDRERPGVLHPVR